MAQRRPKEEDDVSLFPFLSIIAAVIGVLTLMIAAVTLGQMNQEDVQQVVENAIAVEQLGKQLAAAKEEAQVLKLKLDEAQAELLKRAGSRQTEIVKTRAELEALLKQLAEVERTTREMQEVKIVIPEVPPDQRESLADMQGQMAAIEERLAALTVELKQRREPPEEATVSIVPSGSGLSYVPNFVECTADAIVLHTRDEPLTIRTADVAASGEFVALMEKVVNAGDQTLVFLLRADGLGTYRAVKKLCDDHEVPNGKLPVAGNGRLDLSHFRKAS